MKSVELRKKDDKDLYNELIELRREHFNLRMQKATGQLTALNSLKRVKRDIARVKTILTERKHKQDKA
jgi:large subunit ribosomal protein L29